MKFVRFGEASGTHYTFPANSLAQYKIDFRSARVAMTALSGADGAWDDFVTQRIPRNIGKITQSLIVKAASAALLEDALDEIYALTGYRRKLFIQPARASDDERWCYARVASIQDQAKVEDGRWARAVTIEYRVADPYWLSATGNTTTINASGVQTDESNVTNDGQALARLKVTVTAPSGQTVENPRVEVLDGASNVLDFVSYTGTIDDTETLTFDPNAYPLFDLDGTDVKSDCAFSSLSLLRLRAGAQTVRVEAANSGDQATVTLTWRDTWG